MLQARHRFKPLEMEPSTACHMDLPGQAKPPQLVRDDYSDEGCFVCGDTFAVMVLERMQGRRGATAGPPVICRTHVQGLGRRAAESSAFHMDLAGQAKVWTAV